VGFDRRDAHPHGLGGAGVSSPTLQALVPADHIYRDEGTGKYVIAGTFHQVNLERFPATLGRTVGLFVALRGVDGEADVQFELVGPEQDEPLMRSHDMRVTSPDPEKTVEFAVELPPLPLPVPGRYTLRLEVDGAPLGEAPLEVTAA
jgi:hypothetical protein